MATFKNYTDYALRKPPKNVKVQMIFDDKEYDICYIDDWGMIHGEKTKIYGKNKKPVWWKKKEKNDFGEYIW